MRLLLAVLALSAAVPVQAENPIKTEDTVEAAFAQCIFDKEPELLFAIRDAATMEDAEAAFAQAIELCPTDVETMSMGLFFTAVNELIGPPTYEDEA